MRIWREEGFKGYMRGNGINCLRIVPYSAVQFTTYEQLKKVWLPSLTPDLFYFLMIYMCSGSRDMEQRNSIPLNG